MAPTRRQFVQDSSTLAAAGMMLSFNPLAYASNQRPELDPADWSTVRAQFNLDPNLTHLANFYLASYPTPVRDAVERYRKALDENPYSFLDDHMFSQNDNMLWRKVAAAAARYAGGEADEIALTSSTTMGLALIYNGLRLRPDQEVLTTTHEFYPHHEAIRLATKKWGSSMRTVSLYESSVDVSADAMVARLVAAIRPQTRVLGVTWVHSGTGVVLPIRAVSAALEEVNRKRDDNDKVLLVVDGVHGFGILDEDIARQGSDFFSSGTHKWILGPRGTGIVWGRKASWALIEPTIPSLMVREPSAAWREERQPEGPVQAAWVSPGGFFAYEHQWAVVEAFQFHESIGRTRIANRILDLNGWLIEGLSKMEHVNVWTPAQRELYAGFVCFEVDQLKPTEVAERLRSQGIIASPSPYGKPCMRFSAGIVNSEADIERALAAIKAMG